MLSTKITAYIIAYNEAEKIEAAINSVLWADEILLIDSHSTDGTADIATRMGARVVNVEFKGFGDLRNQAIAACTHEWIFSLDSDERCTAEVRDEILSIIALPASAEAYADVYKVPRRNFFMGRWIKHSGWYPNYRQPQLFKKGAMAYQNQQVHEGYDLLTSKPLDYLKSAIWQMPYKNLEEIIHKMNRYSTLGVARLQDKPAGMGKAFTHGAWAFIKHYIFKLGVLDGWAGFVIAFGYFEVTFYRYAKHYFAMKNWQPPHTLPLRRKP